MDGIDTANALIGLKRPIEQKKSSVEFVRNYSNKLKKIVTNRGV